MIVSGRVGGGVGGERRQVVGKGSEANLQRPRAQSLSSAAVLR